jgi:hypothetical protein
MRHKGEPRLTDDGDYARPIEEQALGEMALHIIPVNMIYNKWECVHQSKNEKGIGNPSVEHLEPLMRHTRKQGNPVCLACSGTEYC